MDRNPAADPHSFPGRVLESIYSNPVFKQVVFETAASELGTPGPAEDKKADPV